MELTSISAKVTLHLKNNEVEAVSIYNGEPRMYIVTKMDAKSHDDFFEVNTPNTTPI